VKKWRSEGVMEWRSYGVAGIKFLILNYNIKNKNRV